MGILTILAASTGGVISRMLLDGNLVRANLEEVELKTAICSKLSDLTLCQSLMITNPPVANLIGGNTNMYGQHLEIVKAEVSDIVDDPYTTENELTISAPATKTLNIWYKRVKTSFATENCSSSDSDADIESNCEKLSIDVQHDPYNCRPVSGCTHTSTAKSPVNCADSPTPIKGCSLTSTSHDTEKSGTCDTTTHTGTCRYRCNGGVWEPVAPITTNTCKAKCFAHSPVSGGSPLKDHCDLVTTEDNFTASGCKTGYTGTCRYHCQDGTWNEESNTCMESCAANPDKDNCNLTAANHNELRSGCKAGYTTGTCSYRCNDGIWADNGNNCKQDCPNEVVSGCTASQTNHGASQSCSNCGSGMTGTKTYQCNDGNWIENTNTCAAAPPPPPVTCPWKLEDGCNIFARGIGGESGSCGGVCYFSWGGWSGTCRYRCKSNRTWDKVSNNCKRGCGATPKDGCSLGCTQHGSSMGGWCSVAGYTGPGCRYSCNDGTWTKINNHCVSN